MDLARDFWTFIQMFQKSPAKTRDTPPHCSGSRVLPLITLDKRMLKNLRVVVIRVLVREP